MDPNPVMLQKGLGGLRGEGPLASRQEGRSDPDATPTLVTGMVRMFVVAVLVTARKAVVGMSMRMMIVVMMFAVPPTLSPPWPLLPRPSDAGRWTGG